MHTFTVAALYTCDLWSPQYFALMALGICAAFIPRASLPLFHVMRGHKQPHSLSIIHSKVHWSERPFAFSPRFTFILKASCFYLCWTHTQPSSLISRCALMSQSPWTQSQQSEPGAAVKIIFPGAFQLLHSLWIHWWESEVMPHPNSYPKFNFFF